MHSLLRRAIVTLRPERVGARVPGKAWRQLLEGAAGNYPACFMMDVLQPPQVTLSPPSGPHLHHPRHQANARAFVIHAAASTMR